MSLPAAVRISARVSAPRGLSVIRRLPSAVVVATARALKFHGGVKREDLSKENIPALEKGLVNLARHLENLAKFGVPVVVGINKFNADTEGELAPIVKFCELRGVKAAVCTHWADGSAGAEQLAKFVVEAADAPLYGKSWMELLDIRFERPLENTSLR